MKRRAPLILAAIACSLLAGGCTAAMMLQNAKYQFLSEEEVNLLDINYAAADYIVGQARGSLTSNSIVLSKPLTESQNPLAPSKFGKVIPEQVAARMVQLGYKVKAAGDVPETRRHFILTGSYLRGQTTVTVSLRLLDSATEQMMGAYDYVIPINEEIDALLQPQPTVMRGVPQP
ncbi:MAG TPA: FlgO family outer membrane protein [Alphaproteobacteria bacterium]|nr:FlgO family outer membrane protein [Alphaproteobacteria bacterium]